MAIIGCVFLAIVVAFIAIMATMLLKGDGSFFVKRSNFPYRGNLYKAGYGRVEEKTVAVPTAGEVIRALALGILAGLANFFATSANPVLAVISLLVMIGLYCLISVWWSSDEYGGDKWSEMVPFVVMALLFICPTLAAAAGTAAALKISGIWAVVLMRFPICVLVLVIGFFIANMYFFRYKYPQKGGE